MEATLNDGRKVWIYWPDQCRLCKGYFFRSENKPCAKEATQEYIDSIRKIEREFRGVYGTTRFVCDYFSLDDEKFHSDPLYSQQDATCSPG